MCPCVNWTDTLCVIRIGTIGASGRQQLLQYRINIDFCHLGFMMSIFLYTLPGNVKAKNGCCKYLINDQMLHSVAL